MKHFWHSLLCLATPVFCQYAGDEYGRGAPSGQETASFGRDNQQVQGGDPDRSYGIAPGYPNNAETLARKKALAQVLDAAEEQAKEKEMAEKLRGYGLIFAIAHPIFSIIGALVFLSLPKNQQPEPMAQAQRDCFAFGLCDGCGHPDSRICLCSICCPTVRWAANASSPKVNFFGYGGYGFWLSLLKMEVLICLPLILGTYRSLVICSLSVLVMYIRNRHKIRQVYGLPTWTCGSCMEDICCSMFCASIGLTIMQEALQLEYVGEPVALGKQVDGESASE